MGFEKPCDLCQHTSFHSASHWSLPKNYSASCTYTQAQHAMLVFQVCVSIYIYICVCVCVCAYIYVYCRRPCLFASVQVCMNIICACICLGRYLGLLMFMMELQHKRLSTVKMPQTTRQTMCTRPCRSLTSRYTTRKRRLEHAFLAGAGATFESAWKCGLDALHSTSLLRTPQNQGSQQRGASKLDPPSQPATAH